MAVAESALESRDRASLLALSLISARDLVELESLPPTAPISVLSGVCSSWYSTLVLSLASANPSACVSAVLSSKTGGYDKSWLPVFVNGD